MKDPNDTRDIDPRVGSPLWIHLMTVTAVGTVAFSLAMLNLHGVFTPHGLITQPVFWLLAVLIVVGEIWPIITPGRTGQEANITSGGDYGQAGAGCAAFNVPGSRKRIGNDRS